MAMPSGRLCRAMAKDKKPDTIAAIGAGAAWAGAFVLVWGECIKSEHEKNAYAHAEYDNTRTECLACGDLGGGFKTGEQE